MCLSCVLGLFVLVYRKRTVLFLRYVMGFSFKVTKQLRRNVVCDVIHSRANFIYILYLEWSAHFSRGTHTCINLKLYVIKYRGSD
jgi:hypothetical protein